MAIGRQARIIYVLSILWKKTNEDHPMSADQIVEQLSLYGIVCERKSVYRDLEQLEEFGFDLVTNQKGTFLATRLLEVPELKLLMDMVQSARFLTEEKTSQLIEKLGKLGDYATFRQLKSQMVDGGNGKAENESVYYNIDCIVSAFQKNCQISFFYYAWSVEGKLELKNNGEKYRISPWFLQWESQQYYLIGYDEKQNGMKHFRLDKMKNIELLSESRKGKMVYDSLNLAEYSRMHFHMYQGESFLITLKCDKELAGAMIDHFGRKVWMHAMDEQHFSIVVSVEVSPKFFGWIAGYSGKIQIVEPSEVRIQYRMFLTSLLECV